LTNPKLSFKQSKTLFT